MATNKTMATSESVIGFINSIEDKRKVEDSLRLVELMEKISGYEAKMWGPSIIGFGSYHYKYASGHEGDAPLLGFSPRAAALTLYLEQDFEEKDEMLSILGKFKTSKACIYIKTLKDVDEKVLERIIKLSFKHSKKNYK